MKYSINLTLMKNFRKILSFQVTLLIFSFLLFLSCKNIDNQNGSDNQSTLSNQNENDLEKINFESLIIKNGIAFKSDSYKPYEGLVFQLNSDGSLQYEVPYKSGKFHGIFKLYSISGLNTLSETIEYNNCKYQTI